MQATSDTSVFKISGLFAVALVALVFLHQTSWLSDDVRVIAGLPAGLVYHIGYCLLVSLVFGLFVYRRKD